MDISNELELYNYQQTMKMGVGTHVKTLVHFIDVPIGTIGIIVEDYGSGFLIEWITLTQKTTFFRPVKDGFDKRTELQYLEIVE